MICTVTANPCIDKTVSVEKFDISTANRADVIRYDCGGKGINSARVIRALGGDAFATGFDFRNGDSSHISDELDSHGIAHDFVVLPGELRLCTKIFDKSCKRMIEINESGGVVPEGAADALMEKIEVAARTSSIITLSGSLPRGIDKDFYAKCVRNIKKSAPPCRVIVDCEGEMLRAAILESPYLIKPNIHEFESTFGVKIETPEELDSEVKKLFLRYGVMVICVSLGERGAYIASREEAYFAPAAEVEVRSLQGAGDAMVAGMAIAFEKELSISEALRYGVAASGATVATPGTLPCERELFEKLLGDIRITKIR